LIDKDDILERLFESKKMGDLAWRRTLSRESDVILQREAESSDGAVLVSFWRQPGMADASGTPTEWLRAICHQVVHIQCACDPELATRRFLQRKRHPGHLDSRASYEEVLASFQDLARLGPLDIEPRIHVDTSRDSNLNDLVRDIRAALE